MLLDAAGLLASETGRRSRHRPSVEPLYTEADALQALELFVPVAYDEPFVVVDGVRASLGDAGHILGSAFVELWLDEAGASRKVVFSGDLGQPGVPILADPSTVDSADFVLLESTYGDRLHRPLESTRIELEEILDAAREGGGNVLIPSFAVGRTQLLLYELACHFDEWGLEAWRIFLDSPMAIDVTEVYLRHSELYDPAALRLLDRNQQSPLLPNLELCRSTDDSRRLNDVRSGAIIIAGSGMCNGGRIVHHLRNQVWRPETHVVIVGFQAAGTPGRRLVDGAEYVTLLGQPVRVGATVHTVGGFSAHGDQGDLLAWMEGIGGDPFCALVHGEPLPAATLAEKLGSQGIRAEPARPGQIYDLKKMPPGRS